MDNSTIPLWKDNRTVGFRVALPPMLSLSKAAYEQFHTQWVTAISLFPPGTIIHKQDCYRQQSWQSTSVLGDEPWNRRRDATFQGRRYVEHTAYLFITKGEEKKDQESIELESFLGIVKQFFQSFQPGNTPFLFKLTALSQDEISEKEVHPLSDHDLDLALFMNHPSRKRSSTLEVFTSVGGCPSQLYRLENIPKTHPA